MHLARLFLIALTLLSTRATAADPSSPPTTPQPARATLSGIVTDDSGKPVEGATVYIWTAGVKKGYSVFCPSCYADCGKRAKSGPDGSFQITSLDPDLYFEVLTVKDHFAPTFNRKVDPVALSSLAITLPARPIPADSQHALRGTIVDPSGKPIPGAFASLAMVMYTDDNGKPGGRGGRVDGLDPIAITNEQGDFTLVYSKHPITGCDIELGARGFALRKLNDLSASQFPIEVTLREGGMVRGRLMHNGKPVSNAQMILTCKEREMSKWLGEVKIGTDEKGEFLFSNIPLYETGPSEWWLAASMDSIKDRGTTQPIVVQVTRNGEDVAVPDIEVKKGYKVTGRFIMPDGAEVTAGSRAMISSETSWDQQHATLNPDGQFEFQGLWNGDYQITPSIKGFRIIGRQVGKWTPPDVHINNADHLNLDLKLEQVSTPKPAQPKQPTP